MYRGRQGKGHMGQVFRARRLWLSGGFRALALAVVVSCGAPGPSGRDASSDDLLGEVGKLDADVLGAGERDDADGSVIPTEPEALRKLTGARTRVVWTQDVADGTDILSAGDQLLLMGHDTDDGRGERALLATPANYAKPLMTPLGNRVVFSDYQRKSAFVVNWDGSGLRRLGAGFALATWIDPESRVEWVYIGTDEAPTRAPSYRTVTRHQIDRGDVSEVVWDKKPVNHNSFQLSADGRLAGGLFPWPHAGVAELPNGSFRPLGTGCWTALAGGSSSLLWYFDGSHRNLTMVDVERDERWRVNINDAPGIKGYEIYHPRWANHPRFLTITGPYTVGDDANKIRAGGRQVEIYLGRFAADFASVEGWVRVTNNQRADFYPDAWIDPTGELPASVVRDVQREAGRPIEEGSDQRAPLVVEARVIESVPIPTPESILPYRRALLVNEYEVLRVVSGAYEEKKILVAHWVIRDAQVLDTAARERGEIFQMSLSLYDEHEELEGERLVMDSDAFDLSLYYDIDR